MFIAKIKEINNWGYVSISRNGRKFILWSQLYEAKTFPTRQKVKIAAKNLGIDPKACLEIIPVTPEIEQEMLVARLKGY